MEPFTLQLCHMLGIYLISLVYVRFQIICMTPAGNDAFYFKGCYRLTDINARIKAAPQDSPLYRLPLLEDPSNDIAEVLVKSVDQEKIQQALTGDRNFSITCELGV